MNTKYEIKEMFLTLQGEGLNTGRAVVLVRFTGCNLSCDFCDTDFTGIDGTGGGLFESPCFLVEKIKELWVSKDIQPIVLFTGGEPLLQLDLPLIKELKRREFTILVESNGTIKASSLIDWLCISPKSNKLIQQSGDEIKIVWPQENISLEEFEDLDFLYFWLQPKFDKNYQLNLQQCIDYCMHNPKWRLSIQTHRVIGID